MAQASTVELGRSSSRSHMEGDVTHRVEQRAAQLPPVGFLGLAVASMVASAALAFFSERKELANFVGLWAPSFLLIGIYNKLLRIENPESVSSMRRVA